MDHIQADDVPDHQCAEHQPKDAVEASSYVQDPLLGIAVRDDAPAAQAGEQGRCAAP